jgi:hypothetical protein
MNKPKLPKGSKLGVVQTQGLMSGSYPLYDLKGLSAGKLQLIIDLLTDAKGLPAAALAHDILSAISHGQSLDG